MKNIICNQEGSGAAARDNNNNNHVMMISAHYDSRMQDINQTDARAPGADDNASGVAAVLELARILSQVDMKIMYNLSYFLAKNKVNGDRQPM